MANYRTDRINEEIMKELCEILRTVKDPRVSGAFVSVTSVDCTQDLKFCKIYYSVLSEKRQGDCGKGLVQATGYIRTALARNLNLRITPELTFINDNSLKNGAHFAELLKKVKEDDEKRAAAAEKYLSEHPEAMAQDDESKTTD